MNTDTAQKKMKNENKGLQKKMLRINNGNFHISNSSSDTYDLFEKCNLYTRADMLKKNKAYPYYIEVEGIHGSSVFMEGHPKLMLGANNYLGIANEDIIREAAKRAVEKYGVGSTAARIVAGSFDLHSRLENKIASFLSREKTLIFTTGYQTNVGTISCLIGRHDYVVVDSQAHASIVDGAHLSLGTVKRFRHNNINDLERVLSSLPKGHILTVVDGVYSMEGDLADLPAIVSCCKKYGSKIMVDEAHGFGIFGTKGQGVAEHFGVQGDIDLIVGTFSKACGSLGGFVAGKEDVINFIKHNARGLLFSTGMPAAALAASEAAFDNFILNGERRRALWNNTERLRNAFQKMGLNTGASMSPIIPIIVGEDLKTTTFWRKLYEIGIFVGAMIPPAVPPNRSLLRFSCSSNLTNEDIDFVVNSVKKVAKELGVLNDGRGT